MKIIFDTTLKTDNVTALTASSEDANFPAANLLNDFTTDLWKAAAGVTEAVLTAQVNKGSAVEILNTNATAITVQAGSGSTYEADSDDENSVEMTAGSGAGNTGIQVANSIHLKMGSGDFAIYCNTALSNWGALAYFGYAVDGTKGVTFVNNANKTLMVQLMYGSTYHNFASTVAHSFVNGSKHKVMVVVSRNLTAKFYIDGLQLGDAVDISSAGTDDISQTSSLYILGAPTTRYASSTSDFALFNFAPSAAEVLDICLNGIPDSMMWGSQTPEYTTDFSTTTGWFTSSGATIAGGVVTFANAAGEDYHRLYRSSGFEAGRLGTYHLLQYEIVSNDMVGGVLCFVGDSINKITPSNIALDVTVGSHTIVLPPVTAGSASYLMFDVIGAISSGAIVMDNVSLWKLGATLDLEPEGITKTQWTDASTNGLHATYPAAGATVNVITSLEDGYTFEDSESYVTQTYSLPGTKGRLWADYPEITTPHIVRATLTASTTVEAGILRAGNVEEFKDPQYGLEESSEDYSTEEELNNGAFYFEVGNIVRVFEGLEMVETRANCHKFKHDIFDQIGPKPLAIRLAHKAITDWEYVLFAKRIDPPEIIHDAGAVNSRLKFNLKEVV